MYACSICSSLAVECRTALLVIRPMTPCNRSSTTSPFKSDTRLMALKTAPFFFERVILCHATISRFSYSYFYNTLSFFRDTMNFVALPPYGYFATCHPRHYDKKWHYLHISVLILNTPHTLLPFAHRDLRQLTLLPLDMSFCLCSWP